MENNWLNPTLRVNDYKIKSICQVYLFDYEHSLFRYRTDVEHLYRVMEYRKVPAGEFCHGFNFI